MSDYFKGMTITCFDCVTLTAVLMFEVDTTSQSGGAKIALLAGWFIILSISSDGLI